MAWTSLCELNDLVDGTGKYVELDGYYLAVFLHLGKVHVMDNRCPHAGGSMSAGWIDENNCAVCPWHAWGFDLTTGALKGAESVKLAIYASRVLERPGKPALVQADLPMP